DRGGPSEHRRGAAQPIVRETSGAVADRSPDGERDGAERRLPRCAEPRRYQVLERSDRRRPIESERQTVKALEDDEPRRAVGPRHEKPAKRRGSEGKSEQRAEREATFEPRKSEKAEHLGGDAERHARARDRRRQA